jgi:hypothetical protein
MRSPEGTWLAEQALVAGCQMDRAWLTITSDHATLRVDSTALPHPMPAEGYDCRVLAGGWRWSFQAIAEGWTVPNAYSRSRVLTVALHSMMGPTAEPARTLEQPEW